MRRPVVGIIGNSNVVNGEYPVQAAGLMNIDAVSQVCDAIPVIIPALPSIAEIGELLTICEGFVFTGGRPNVHPSFYGQKPTPKHGDFDMNRDHLTLPLIQACVEVGKPILGICRGFQEFNVAFGGSLHPEIRELPGRMNHRMPPDGSLEEKFALRHKVYLEKGGAFSDIFNTDIIVVNSLHGQGVDEPGLRVIVEGHADDGTPEAIRIADADGFALAVQWHPEWNAAHDEVSKPLFSAFGDAIHGRR